jgi:hypothetical protein
VDSIVQDPIAQDKVQEFKDWTARRVQGVRCPDHHQPPRLRFHGSSLRDVSIQMSGCCEKLIALANQKIAGR